MSDSHERHWPPQLCTDYRTHAHNAHYPPVFSRMSFLVPASVAVTRTPPRRQTTTPPSTTFILFLHWNLLMRLRQWGSGHQPPANTVRQTIWLSLLLCYFHMLPYGSIVLTAGVRCAEEAFSGDVDWQRSLKSNGYLLIPVLGLG